MPVFTVEGVHGARPGHHQNVVQGVHVAGVHHRLALPLRAPAPGAIPDMQLIVRAQPELALEPDAVVVLDAVLGLVDKLPRVVGAGPDRAIQRRDIGRSIGRNGDGVERVIAGEVAARPAVAVEVENFTAAAYGVEVVMGQAIDVFEANLREALLLT